MQCRKWRRTAAIVSVLTCCIHNAGSVDEAWCLNWIKMRPQKWWFAQGKGKGSHVVGEGWFFNWRIIDRKSLERPCKFRKLNMCRSVCFHECVLGTAGQRQKDKDKGRVRGSVIAWGRGREIVCSLTHQGHPELKCDWKSPVCLGCLPHEIIQTGCSADNVTVLTTPPFSFCFKLPVKWQECGNVIPTHTQAQDKPRQGHTQQTLSDVWF